MERIFFFIRQMVQVIANHRRKVVVLVPGIAYNIFPRYNLKSS